MIQLLYNDTLAEEHYKWVKPLIINRIDNVIRDRGIFTRVGRTRVLINLSPLLQRFLELLKDNGLKTLIMAKPKRLERLLGNVIKSNSDFTKKDSDNYFILYNIFVTHTYRNTAFDKKDFIDKVGLNTCPYCNRNYTFSLSKSRKIKPEIDHFYPASRYPFLAISYYNLIPCCQTCNGLGGKSNTDPYIVGLKSPYEISTDDFIFSYRPIVLDQNNPLKKTSIEVYFIKKIQVNSDLFKLEDLYKKHDDHVVELIFKRKIKYSKKYIKYLMKFKGFNFSEDEIDRMILGNYCTDDQIHKRPLAKLYQNIGRELGIIR